MSSMRNHVGLLFAIAAVACGGSKTSSTPITNTGGTGDEPPPPAVIPIGNPSDAHRLLPPSANAYIGVDFAKLSDAAILERYRDMIAKELPSELREIQAACKFDVMKDLDWMIGALNLEGEDGVFVIKGNFSQEQIEGCMKDVAQRDGQQITMTDEEGVRIYDSGNGDRLLTVWPTESVVAILADEKSRSMIDALASRVRVKDVDPSVAELLKTVDTNAAMWMTAREISNMPMGNSQDVAGIRVEVEVGSTVDLIGGAEFISSKVAGEVYNQAIMGIQMVKGHPMAAQFGTIIDKLKIAHTDRLVSLALNLTADDLQLIETAMGQMGMGVP